MRILFIGDIVGAAGATSCSIEPARLIATGSSISSSSTARTPPAASASPRRSINEFIDAGADAITLGNHAWDQREALVFIERAPR
jgi:calcineurin-like phosphoesterase